MKKIKDLIERLEMSYNELKRLDDIVTAQRKTVKSKDMICILKELQSLICILKYLLSDVSQILEEMIKEGDK